MESRRTWVIGGAVAAVIIYAAMWVGYVQNWAWLDAVDTGLLRVFHDFGTSHPGWVSFWVVFCIVFGPTAFRLVALVVIAVALARRNLQTALFLVISVELMGLVTEGAKWLSNRPRPSTALVYGIATSFPSGHALGVMVAVLSLLTVLWPLVPQRLRTSVIVISGVLVFMVGFARVILNVHNPSDVVAGWALGFLYYLLCVRLVPPRPFSSTAERRAELDSVP